MAVKCIVSEAIEQFSSYQNNLSNIDLYDDFQVQRITVQDIEIRFEFDFKFPVTRWKSLMQARSTVCMYAVAQKDL